MSLESMNQREADTSPKGKLLRLIKIKVHLKENLASQQWEQKLSPLGRYKTKLIWCNRQKLQRPQTHQGKNPLQSSKLSHTCGLRIISQEIWAGSPNHHSKTSA